MAKADLKGKVAKLSADLDAALKAKDDGLAAAREKIARLRTQLEEANEKLGETDG